MLNQWAALGDNFDAVRAIVGRTGPAAPLDVYSFSILIHKSPDYAAAREIFDEMRAAGVAPNFATESAVTSLVQTPEQATETKVEFAAFELAGTAFHQSVFKQLSQSLSATELLAWGFSAGGRFPFPALDAAVGSYRRQGKLDDALRIVSAFPHLEPCKKLFRDLPDQSHAYLMDRYEGGEEPHHAAYALAIRSQELGDDTEALRWMEIARDHPDTTPGKQKMIVKATDAIKSRS